MYFQSRAIKYKAMSKYFFGLWHFENLRYFHFEKLRYFHFEKLRCFYFEKLKYFHSRAIKYKVMGKFFFGLRLQANMATLQPSPIRNRIHHKRKPISRRWLAAAILKLKTFTFQLYDHTTQREKDSPALSHQLGLIL